MNRMLPCAVPKMSVHLLVFHASFSANFQDGWKKGNRHGFKRANHGEALVCIFNCNGMTRKTTHLIPFMEWHACSQWIYAVNPCLRRKGANVHFKYSGEAWGSHAAGVAAAWDAFTLHYEFNAGSKSMDLSLSMVPSGCFLWLAIVKHVPCWWLLNLKSHLDCCNSELQTRQYTVYRTTCRAQ